MKLSLLCAWLLHICWGYLKKIQNRSFYRLDGLQVWSSNGSFHGLLLAKEMHNHNPQAVNSSLSSLKCSGTENSLCYIQSSVTDYLHTAQHLGVKLKIKINHCIYHRPDLRVFQWYTHFFPLALLSAQKCKTQNCITQMQGQHLAIPHHLPDFFIKAHCHKRQTQQNEEP